jgi:hypothetical protein
MLSSLSYCLFKLINCLIIKYISKLKCSEGDADYVCCVQSLLRESCRRLSRKGEEGSLITTQFQNTQEELAGKAHHLPDKGHLDRQ